MALLERKFYMYSARRSACKSEVTGAVLWRTIVHWLQ